MKTMNKGWIKLHREILDKSIWINSTAEQKVILITILLKANHQSNKWEFAGDQFECKAGQFITSLESLTAACGKGITINKVRTALQRFEKLGFLTNKSTNKGRLITIVNWDFYQDGCEEFNSQENKQNTSRTQAEHKQNTTNKNEEECENDKKEKKYKYGAFKKVKLTDSEKDKLIQEFGQAFFEACVKELDEYKEQNGKNYQNDNLAIRKWVVDAVKRKGSVTVETGKTTEQRAEYEQVCL